ncbi:histidine kinase [Aeromicrobium sp. IC_218]|uniref:sensor histidine kinase n=1 Tax=Aeromicrobium sp. IC_218 TaxID=2545468 RepID=UPI00103E9131|nr:histidine kinase [Aeromicrobium sp. IC_218]TCI98836.1 sensor histidine kinase [Aeromicrobium sp. IC_218]
MTRLPRPSAADRRVALVTGALALAALVAVAVAAHVAPESDVVTPVPSTTSWVLGGIVLVAQAVALLWRRAAPEIVLLAASAGLLLAALAGLGDATGLAQLAVLVAAFTLGLAKPPARAWPTYLAAAVLLAVGGTISTHAGGDTFGASLGIGVLQAIGTLALPVVVALVVASRREVRQAREGREAALLRERDALVQAAIARERTAMARELHDIAAHHLSGIAVMTAAIGTQIDTDPEAAKASVAQVRRSSTSVLRDLRSLVGLLREGDVGETRPESLAGVAALVDDAVAAGRDAGLTVLTGEHPLGHGVGPLAQLAAYRMVQESLANAARHAPGSRVEVTVDDRDASAVVVTVANDRSPVASVDAGGGGFGLVGMRERADLTGASLVAGPTDDGGWRVVLRVPRDPDADTETDPREDA